jgi:peroxiredoxin
VNDPFSLAAWSQEEGTDQVHFIPDMTGDFTRAIRVSARKNVPKYGM